MEYERQKVYIEITEDNRIAVSWMGIQQGEIEVLNILGAAAQAVQQRLTDRAIVTPARKPPFEIVRN